MNKNRNKFVSFALVLTLVVSISSCNWVDPDINIDPDSPTEVPLKNILPNVQANMAYDIGGNDIVRTLNIWMQYYNGYARQSLTEGRYSYTPSNPNNVWNSLYWNALQDIKQMRMKAEETESNHFLGVINILNATTLMTLTDLWNDIPWSEALMGGENLSPKLDTQESVYAVIVDMLDDAIAQLQEDQTGLKIEGDMIFGGDAEKWLGAAYAIKARAILVQSKRNASAYTELLAVLDEGGIASTDDNMVFFFSEDEGCAHPIYQFVDERDDITMGKTFVDMLIADADPRLPFFATDEDAGFVGGVIGSEDDEEISKPGDYAAAHDAGVWFITYAEQEFMRAEALLSTNPANAFQAYINGAMSSLVQVGVDTAGITATPFYTNLTSGGAGALTLERIIRQKYIALYNTMYAYNDWRRTGFPTELVLPQDAVLNQTPRRYPYAQSEITYNSNVNPVSISSRVWWDVE